MEGEGDPEVDDRDHRHCSGHVLSCTGYCMCALREEQPIATWSLAAASEGIALFGPRRAVRGLWS